MNYNRAYKYQGDSAKVGAFNPHTFLIQKLHQQANSLNVGFLKLKVINFVTLAKKITA
jgi:hypothetical protein